VKQCLLAYRQLLALTGRVFFAWLHCHSPVGGALARMVAHQRGIRVVYTAHGFHFYQGASWKNWLLYYPAEWLLSFWTDTLVTVNREDYAAAGKRLHAQHVRYIPGIGVAVKQCGDTGTETAEQFLEKFDLPKNATVLLSVGELSRRKNHQIVLAALAALGRQDLYYLICGQGSERERLLKTAERQGVAAYVRMPGYQRNMAWIYRNAHLFVFPSMQEGMPVALMEAMAAGLPCVVSDIRGNRELIRARACRFQPESLPELAAALDFMLSCPEWRQQCRVNNRTRIRAYSSGIVQQRMKEIYRDMGSRDLDNRNMDSRDADHRDMDNRDADHRDMDHIDMNSRDIDHRDIDYRDMNSRDMGSS